MPNYQLPEIPGGVVWVPCEFVKGEKLIWNDDLATWLKPIPVTPVKEVEVWKDAQGDTLPLDDVRVLCLHIDSGNVFISWRTKDCLTGEPKWYNGVRPTHWMYVPPIDIDNKAISAAASVQANNQELKLALYWLISAAKKTNLTPLLEKRIAQANYILNKNFDILDVLRGSTPTDNK